MRKSLLACVLGAGLLASVPAHAADADEATLADNLGQCFIMKTNGEDRLAAARWIAAIMASTDKVKDTVTVSPQVKDQLDRKMAQTFTRLMTVDCVEQSKALAKMHSTAGFQRAGEALGRIAMQELLSGPGQTEALSGYLHYLNPADFSNLAK